MVPQDTATETHHWVNAAVLPHHTAADVGLLAHHGPGTHHAVFTHLSTSGISLWFWIGGSGGAFRCTDQIVSHTSSLLFPFHPDTL